MNSAMASAKQRNIMPPKYATKDGSRPTSSMDIRKFHNKSPVINPVLNSGGIIHFGDKKQKVLELVVDRETDQTSNHEQSKNKGRSSKGEKNDTSQMIRKVENGSVESQDKDLFDKEEKIVDFSADTDADGGLQPPQVATEPRRASVTHASFPKTAAVESRHDVMISYSHQDMELMRFVRNSLTTHGIVVWVDEEGLSAGVDFLSKIGKAIVDSTAFLQILTTNSVVSKYCKDELSLAYVSSKPIFVVCDSDRDELFKNMDFGQKLTLSPYKNGFVDLSDTRFRKPNIDFLCEDLKQKLREEFKFGDRLTGTSEAHIENDISAENFWKTYMQTKPSVVWNDFRKVFMDHYEEPFQALVPQKDRNWLLHILKRELCSADEDEDVIFLEDLTRLCLLEGEEHSQPVWASVQKYAREQYAIKGVFAIDSTVRLDAIENLGKFKSTAVQEALLDLLKDPDPNVRSVAALSLAKTSNCGDIAVTSRVGKLLKDQDRLVRESSCVSLGRMKAVDQVTRLVAIWRNDVISVVRDAALLALELIGGEEAARAIHVTKILSDEIKAITAS